MFFKDFRRIKKLGKYLTKDKKTIYLILIVLLPVAFSGAIQPLLVGQAITILKNESSDVWLSKTFFGQSINAIILSLFISVLFRLFLQGYQTYNIQAVGQRLTARIRRELFDHSISLSLKYHDKMPVGKLLTRLTNDVDALAEVFGSGAVGVIADFVSLIVISLTMLSIDKGLAILLLLTQIPVSYFIIWLQKRYRRANYQVREELSQLNSDIQENLQGLEVVQMFRREAFNSKKFSSTGVAYKRAVYGTIFYDSSISAFIEWISLAAVSLVLAVGGYLVTSGNIGLGTLTTFILYSQRLFEPLRQLAERFTQIQGGLTAVERINELLDEEIQIKDSISAKNFSKDAQTANKQFKGKIEFKNVNFFYKEGEHILKNLSFKINPGEHVAFVGPTGSGKTTIIRLLCRLYEPQSGQIFIDDIDIKDIPIATLRNMLGVVLQDTFIFSGNVADNLKLMRIWIMLN